MTYMKDSTGRRLDGIKVLSATEAARYARRAQTLVVYGDSLTEQGGEIPANPDTRSFAPWTWANVELNQAFAVLANLGIGGETTSQIRARLPAVLALAPGWVHLICGTNNVGTASGVATAQTDITAILDAFDDAGIRAIIGTIPPRISANYTGTIKADTLALNEWIRQQARARANLLVVDYFAALADGTTSNYLGTIAGFNPTSDGTHLSATGAWVCGRQLANTVRPHIGTNAVPYSASTPGANLLAASRFVSNGAAAPTGWTVGGTGAASAVWSDVARSDYLGSWKQVVIGTGTAVTMNVNANVDGTRLAVGDLVNGILEFEVSAMEQAAAVDAQGIALSLRAWNGTAYTSMIYAFNYFRGPNAPRGGVLRTPSVVVPAGTTIVSMYVELRGGMTFKMDRPGIYARKTYAV